MSVRLAASRGEYLLRWWHEPAGEGFVPVAVRGDPIASLALSRSAGAAPGALGAIRALLARDLAMVHRLDDADVLRELSARLAAGQIVAEHAPAAGLFARDGVDAEPEPARVPDAKRPEPKTWIEIELVDMEGKPVAGERYWIQLPDGSAREGRLNAEGRAYFGDLDPGECDVRFPDLDNDAVAAPGEPKLPQRPPRPKRPRKTWVEIALVGMDNSPIPNEAYRIQLPTGEIVEGRLDERGRALVDGIDPGTCTVSFPALDEEAWEPV
jgi:hypothetical protein